MQSPKLLTQKGMTQKNCLLTRWKVSSSSDEFIDTSDKNINVSPDTSNAIAHFITDVRASQGAANRRTEEQAGHQEKTPSPKERAKVIILKAEQSKARMYDVSGEFNRLNLNMNQSSILMDEDYQMIDAHLEESLKCKIWEFDYIDLSCLINKSQSSVEGPTQRLGIVNRDGVSYLTPVSERESVVINSYGHWEQVFCIYSNVLSTHYPFKAPEFLQYNHTIHSASTTYVWENVYEYDREFRYHISRHPKRSWAIILQQAWTMLLKDRIKQGGFPFSPNASSQDRPYKEICKRFNRGTCTYGLRCKFDHHCAVKKCGKFGHGAHICRKRKDRDEAEGDKFY